MSEAISTRVYHLGMPVPLLTQSSGQQLVSATQSFSFSRLLTGFLAGAQLLAGSILGVGSSQEKEGDQVEFVLGIKPRSIVDLESQFVVR